jgi:hypothetical protein
MVTIVTTLKAGPVEKATRAELRKLGRSVQSEGLAALAVSLARQIDTSRGAVAAAAAAGQLRVILADLRAASAREMPERDAVDDIAADELAARRSAAG